jgi:hypothetical protein
LDGLTLHFLLFLQSGALFSFVTAYNTPGCGAY